MSVYSIVPNGKIWLRQSASIDSNGEVPVAALTPPNTPTHGVIISTGPPDQDSTMVATNDDDDDDVDYRNGATLSFSGPVIGPTSLSPSFPAKAYMLMNSDSCSGQSTPLSDCTETPDSMMMVAPGNQPDRARQGRLPSAAGKRWNALDTRGKIARIGLVAGRALALITLLYLFICSLDLLSTSLRLLGARVIGTFFQDNALLQNPVVGLMIGVLVTVLVQSSSTSTSIAVTMVASRIIHVRQAIPIVMGANIGTSVTNTIVSLMQSSDRAEFGRAFAAATVHDMFNWLTVVTLLPLEVATGYLERSTTKLLAVFVDDDGAIGEIGPNLHANGQFLNRLTKPFTRRIIQIDNKLVEALAYGPVNGTNTTGEERLLVACCSILESGYDPDKCSLLGWIYMSDTATGIVLLVISILVLCLCLLFLVKLLNSMLTGPISKLIQHWSNSQFTIPYSILANYGAILVGCLLTILVQSSSIFTSALTPLAGIGIISLERIYPLTLGANIGTTTTGILAALAAEPNRIRDTMQIALCHLLFNLTGIALFYPVPFMRWPIPMARALGNITARYRWFALFYLVAMFFLLPILVFSLSTLGPHVIAVVITPILAVAVLVLLVNLTQRHRPGWLPNRLRDWSFLPLWLRSLEPLDRLITGTGARCCPVIVPVVPPTGRGTRLGHHQDSHHSRLHMLVQDHGTTVPTHDPEAGQIPDNVQVQAAEAADNDRETLIKRFISKLSRPSLQHSYDRRPSSRHWSLFNAHTVHSGCQVNRNFSRDNFRAIMERTTGRQGWPLPAEPAAVAESIIDNITAAPDETVPMLTAAATAASDDDEKIL